MIDESRENIMKEKFVELRAKTYSYLIDHSSGDKKGKLQFEDPKNCLEGTKT